MRNLRSAAAGTSVLALSVAVAGLAALALATPDRMIGGTVAASLGGGRSAPGLPVDGSEAFWLSGHAVTADSGLSSPWGKPIALGDQITVGAAGDVKRVLEVVELRELPDVLLRASDAGATAKLTLVTCRDGSGGLVRFIVEGEADRVQHKPALEKVL